MFYRGVCSDLRCCVEVVGVVVIAENGWFHLSIWWWLLGEFVQVV